MAHFYERISFVVGLAIGVVLAFHFRPTVVINEPSSTYKTWFSQQNLTRKSVNWDTIRYTNAAFVTESAFLHNKIKILCIILVKSERNFVSASATWAKGCNRVKAIYLESNRKQMPRKVDKRKSSWFLLCNNLLEENQFDWTLIVQDTSFVIMENLRFYVAPLDKDDKHYLGHAVKFWSTIYNSKEPGYVLSRGTIKAFNKFMTREKCEENRYWNKEDYYLGQYLANLNVTVGPTYDDKGLTTFYPYSWYQVFFPGGNYYRNAIYRVKCCSKRSIAFKAIDGDKMYFYNYILYNLQIFTGGDNGNVPFKDGTPVDLVWKSFVQGQNVSVKDQIGADQYYKLWEGLVNDPDSFAKNMKKEHSFDYD
ncbi:glycoprotein-N-acetylgalactosamine 3-beta-galactosyltransferase 1-like [Anthonomus grandis grandis]|uniref:glycoprotein-N-acetylgalactosamine 3-beta-galactosyltransferase 1-like n=1 Tax=Anthonomus grandis grandis TaxID=2921223 RepID=UPI002165FA7C|nr:glycoprotein-N-acetylgalactosamine 3-beta-galactosyltransferase 1-like [Anthonomus grandis grandis]